MHKLKLQHFLLAASLSLGAQAAHAASLGALTVLSNIGQPLHAEIDIIPASEQELATVSAKLASAAVFAEHGVQLSAELSSVQFDVDTRPDGKPVLRLSTIEAITSPSLDLLIDLSWDGGSLVNKYAVPLEAAPAEDAEAEVALPALAEELPYQALTDEEIEADRQTEDVAIAEDLGELQEVLPAENMSEDAPAAEVADTIQAAPARAVEPAAESTAAALPDYTVESGDTLRNIAVQKSVDGTSLEQLMAGLYRANPHAFVKGDMNRLKTGVILHAPSTSEIKAINQADAEREVHMHAKNWNVYRNKLAGTVAKAEPARDEQTAAQSVSGKIDSVQDQAAASGARDVVKLSGADADNTGKAGKGKQSKSELEEELIARDKALQESNERIAMLEKQLQDANKLLELRKPAALPEKVEPAKPAAAAPGQGWLTTVQEQLQHHPTWAPIGGIAAFVLLVLALLVRFFRKKEGAESVADVPPATEDMAAPAAAPMVAEVAPEPEPTPVPVVEEAAPVVPEPVAELAVPSSVVESEQVPVFGSDAVLDLDDIAALMPETVPETPAAEEAVAEETVAELPQPESEPEIPASAVEAQDAMSLIAAMEQAAAAAAEPAPEPEASAPVVAEEPAQPAPAESVGAFDVDDVFANEIAVAEQEAVAPAEVEAAVPAAAITVEEPAIEAVTTDATALEAEPFDVDDVFAESAAPAAVAEPEPAAETAPQAETAFDVEDVFDSEAALAEFAAEAATHPAPTAEDIAAAALAEEEANDVMAMEAGDVEAEGQFALDDVFDEAATEAGEAVSAAETQAEPLPVEEVAAMPAEEPPTKVEAKTDDHSEALAAAFDESAVADLNDLDFGFDIDLGDVAAKTPAKPAAAEKVAALDFSNISLNVGGAPAGDAAAASAEPPEVDTKLDLVTAYIDMSDEEGARELLQEVLKEGGPNQIAKAQKLLESLG